MTNQAPSCSALCGTVAEHHVLTATIDNSCSDPDSGPNPLSYTNPSNRPHGTVSGFQTTDGSFTYTPDLGYVQADSFTVTVSDGNQ